MKIIDLRGSFEGSPVETHKGSVAVGEAVKIASGEYAALSADTDKLAGVVIANDGTNSTVVSICPENEYEVDVASVTDSDVTVSKKTVAVYFTGTAFTTVATDNTLVGRIVRLGSYGRYVVKFNRDFIL